MAELSRSMPIPVKKSRNPGLLMLAIIGKKEGPENACFLDSGTVK
jgi:hypothetical protein